MNSFLRVSLLSSVIVCGTGLAEAAILEASYSPVSFDNRPPAAVALGAWHRVDCDDTRQFELDRWSETTLQRITGSSKASSNRKATTADSAAPSLRPVRSAGSPAGRTEAFRRSGI